MIFVMYLHVIIFVNCFCENLKYFLKLNQVLHVSVFVYGSLFYLALYLQWLFIACIFFYALDSFGVREKVHKEEIIIKYY
jgi:hypothetical protein